MADSEIESLNSDDRSYQAGDEESESFTSSDDEILSDELLETTPTQLLDSQAFSQRPSVSSQTMKTGKKGKKNSSTAASTALSGTLDWKHVDFNALSQLRDSSAILAWATTRKRGRPRKDQQPSVVSKQPHSHASLWDNDIDVDSDDSEESPENNEFSEANAIAEAEDEEHIPSKDRIHCKCGVSDFSANDSIVKLACRHDKAGFKYFLQCDVCEMWQHKVCANFSLNLNDDDLDRMEYKCFACNDEPIATCSLQQRCAYATEPKIVDELAVEERDLGKFLFIRCRKCNNWVHRFCARLEPRGFPTPDFLCYDCYLSDCLQSANEATKFTLLYDNEFQTNSVNLWYLQAKSIYKYCMENFGINNSENLYAIIEQDKLISHVAQGLCNTQVLSAVSKCMGLPEQHNSQYTAIHYIADLLELSYRKYSREQLKKNNEMTTFTLSGPEFSKYTSIIGGVGNAKSVDPSESITKRRENLNKAYYRLRDLEDRIIDATAPLISCIEDGTAIVVVDDDKIAAPNKTLARELDMTIISGRKDPSEREGVMHCLVLSDFGLSLAARVEFGSVKKTQLVSSLYEAIGKFRRDITVRTAGKSDRQEGVIDNRDVLNIDDRGYTTIPQLIKYAQQGAGQLGTVKRFQGFPFTHGNNADKEIKRFATTRIVDRLGWQTLRVATAELRVCVLGAREAIPVWVATICHRVLKQWVVLSFMPPPHFKGQIVQNISNRRVPFVFIAYETSIGETLLKNFGAECKYWVDIIHAKNFLEGDGAYSNLSYRDALDKFNRFRRDLTRTFFNWCDLHHLQPLTVGQRHDRNWFWMRLGRLTSTTAFNVACAFSREVEKIAERFIMTDDEETLLSFVVGGFTKKRLEGSRLLVEDDFLKKSFYFAFDYAQLHGLQAPQLTEICKRLHISSTTGTKEQLAMRIIKHCNINLEYPVDFGQSKSVVEAAMHAWFLTYSQVRQLEVGAMMEPVGLSRLFSFICEILDADTGDASLNDLHKVSKKGVLFSYGLIGRRDSSNFGTSVDGIACELLLNAMNDNNDDNDAHCFEITNSFIVEGKSLQSADTLQRETLYAQRYGRIFYVKYDWETLDDCSVPVEDKSAGVSVTYRAQVLHHASIMNINRVLLVYYGEDKVLPIRCVLFEFETAILREYRSLMSKIFVRYDLRKIIDSDIVLQEKEIIEARSRVKSLDSNETLSVAMRIRRMIDLERERSTQHQLLPSFRRIIPLMVHLYNKGKGGVDTKSRLIVDTDNVKIGGRSIVAKIVHHLILLLATDIRRLCQIIMFVGELERGPPEKKNKLLSKCRSVADIIDRVNLKIAEQSSFNKLLYESLRAICNNNGSNSQQEPNFRYPSFVNPSVRLSKLSDAPQSRLQGNKYQHLCVFIRQIEGQLGDGRSNKTAYRCAQCAAALCKFDSQRNCFQEFHRLTLDQLFVLQNRILSNTSSNSQSSMTNSINNIAAARDALSMLSDRSLSDMNTNDNDNNNENIENGDVEMDELIDSDRSIFDLAGTSINSAPSVNNTITEHSIINTPYVSPRERVPASQTTSQTTPQTTIRSNSVRSNSSLNSGKRSNSSSQQSSMNRMSDASTMIRKNRKLSEPHQGMPSGDHVSDMELPSVMRKLARQDAAQVEANEEHMRNVFAALQKQFPQYERLRTPAVGDCQFICMAWHLFPDARVDDGRLVESTWVQLVRSKVSKCIKSNAETLAQFVEEDNLIELLKREGLLKDNALWRTKQSTIITKFAEYICSKEKYGNSLTLRAAAHNFERDIVVAVVGPSLASSHRANNSNSTSDSQNVITQPSQQDPVFGYTNTAEMQQRQPADYNATQFVLDHSKAFNDKYAWTENMSDITCARPLRAPIYMLRYDLELNRKKPHYDVLIIREDQ